MTDLTSFGNFPNPNEINDELNPPNVFGNNEESTKPNGVVSVPPTNPKISESEQQSEPTDMSLKAEFVEFRSKGMLIVRGYVREKEKVKILNLDNIKIRFEMRPSIGEKSYSKDTKIRMDLSITELYHLISVILDTNDNILAALKPQSGDVIVLSEYYHKSSNQSKGKVFRLMATPANHPLKMRFYLKLSDLDNKTNVIIPYDYYNLKAFARKLDVVVKRLMQLTD